jgi:hypothetical protein
MSMPNKLLSVEIPAQTLEILEILCWKTKRKKEDFVEEALRHIFDEYKESIFDTLKMVDFQGKINLARVPHKNISIGSYQGKKQVEVITELELLQINLARQIIIQDSSHYSQTLKSGGYLYDDLSKWQVFDVENSDLGITRVVLWNERDDGSFSVHFSGLKKIPLFYCFEN